MHLAKRLQAAGWILIAVTMLPAVAVWCIVYTDRQVQSGRHAWFRMDPFFKTIASVGRVMEMTGTRYALATAGILTGCLCLLVALQWFRTPRDQRGGMPGRWGLAAALGAGIWSQFLTFSTKSVSAAAWILFGAAFVLVIGSAFFNPRESADTPVQPIRNRRWIMLAGVLLLAGMFRLYRIDNLPPGQAQHTAEWGMTGARLARREPFDLLSGSGRDVFAREMRLRFAVEPHQIGGNIFFDWMLASLYKPSFIAQRTVSACFGVLSVAAVYFAANAFLNPSAAVIAALLAAVSPWHNIHSRYSSPEHILAILFTTLTGWLAIRFLRRRTPGVMIGLIITLIVDFYLYVTAQFMVPVVGVMIVFALAAGPKRKQLLAGVLVAGILVSIGIAPKTGLYGMKDHVKLLNTQISEHPSYEVQGFTRIRRNTVQLIQGIFLNGDGEAWFTKTHGYLLWPTAVALIIGLGVTLRRIAALEYAFLLVWFVIGIVPTIPAPVVAPRRILCALPVIFLIAAVGVIECRRLFQKPSVWKGVACIVAGLMICGGWQAFSVHSTSLEARRNGPERRLAEIVCRFLPDHRVVVLAEAHTRLEKIMLMCGDLDPEAPPRPVLFAASNAAIDVLLPDIDVSSETAVPVVFISYSNDAGRGMLNHVREVFPGGSDLSWRYDREFADHSTGEVLFSGWRVMPDSNAGKH